jgi:hypothetical protein
MSLKTEDIIVNNDAVLEFSTRARPSEEVKIFDIMV